MPLRSKVALSVLGLVVVVGLAPLVWLLWWSNPRRVEPLSVPVTIKRGLYISAPFVPAIPAKGEQYQIDLYFLPETRAPLNLEWKVVCDGGAVLANGEYRERNGGGNVAVLGYYRPTGRSTQRVILNVHDVDSFDTTLRVELPERSLDAAYGFPLAIGWAVVVIGVGIIGFVIFWAYHRRTGNYAVM